MLNIFRHNSLLAAISLIVLAAVFRIQFFLDPKPYELMYSAFLSNILFDFLKTFGNPHLISYIAAYALVVAQALMLNYTVSRHEILYKDTYLPGFMFVLMNSLYAEQFQLTPQLLSNTFIILLFQRLCYLYESPKPLLLVFDSGMYLGVGIMFNYYLILFLPFILISVVVFTSFNLRYIIISLMGILLPMYFVFIFFYMTNRLPELQALWESDLYVLSLRPVIHSLEQLAPWLLLLPLAAIGAFHLQQNFFRNKVKTRRIIQSIAIFTLFGSFALITERNNMLYSAGFISIPLSIVTGYYLISSKRFWLKEIVIYAVMAMVAYYQLH